MALASLLVGGTSPSFIDRVVECPFFGLQHQEEAADPALNRLFRRCDEKVTAQHERLSSRRPRKHSRARDPQDFDRPRKKPNKPQISTSPSHLVEVNLALDSDANSIDLGTI